MKLLKYTLISFFILLLGAAPNITSAKVWYVNSSTGDNLYTGESAAVAPPNIGPFKDIQWAINMTLPGDTIYLADGYYFENIDIDRPLTILGNNAGIPYSGTRNLESIIQPSASDLTQFPNRQTCVIYITSPDVVIDGIMIDGDNTSLSTGNNVRGADVDIAYGISNSGPFDNQVIANSIIENIDFGGIYLRGNINNPNFNCSVNNNKISNLGDGARGINCESGFYSTIDNNFVQDASFGIFIRDFTTSNSRNWIISKNRVEASTIGLVIQNLRSSPSNMFVLENEFTTPTGLVSDFGVYLINNRDNFSVRFENNNISNTSEGYSISNNNIQPLVFLADTFENCDYSVRLINYQNNNKTDSLTFEKCLFERQNAAGVDVLSDTNRTDLIFNNCTFDSLRSGIILRGNVHAEPGNSAFSRVQDYYIQINDAVSNIRSGDGIDATGCTMNGLTGAASTDSMNFLNEDKFRHFMDDNRFAFITFKPEHIYVTHNDGNIFITPAIAMASDDWHIFIDTVDQSEDIDIDKQLHIHTRGEVIVGSINMVAPGKTAFLHGDLAMSNTLALKAGILNTLDGVAIVGKPQVAPPFMKLSGGSINSYVEGPLQVVLSTKANDSTYFPVGKSGDYRPITIITESSNLGMTGALEAELFQGEAPFQQQATGITHISQIHHWNTQNVDALNFDNVQFIGTYDTSTNNDEVSNTAELRLVVEENGSWLNLGGTGTAIDKGSIQSDNSNTAISFVALANVAQGTNALGKSGAIAAFDYSNPCFPNPVSFTDISATTQGVINSWEWDFGDASSTVDTSIVQNPTYTYPSSGSYDVRLIVTNDQGDIDTVTRSVLVTSPPSAGFDFAIPCFPSAVTLNDTSLSDPADPIVSWNWIVDTTVYSTAQVSHSFDTTGSYSVGLKVTTQNGCTDSVGIAIFQGDSVKIAISPTGPISICDGDTVVLSATTGIQSYLWSTGETTASISATTGGTYRVAGINSNSCTGLDSVTVIVNPIPVADAGLDQIIEYGETAQLNGSGGGSYSWTPLGTLSSDTIANPIASPVSTTLYILTVSNSSGCEDSDSVLITVNPQPSYDIPNLITPNGDGLNDNWDLSFLPGINEAKVSVISRWGKEVYMSFEYQNDWQGTNGTSQDPLPEGTYMYILENGDTFGTIKGSIQIIR